MARVVSIMRLVGVVVGLPVLGLLAAALVEGPVGLVTVVRAVDTDILALLVLFVVGMGALTRDVARGLRSLPGGTDTEPVEDGPACADGPAAVVSSSRGDGGSRRRAARVR